MVIGFLVPSHLLASQIPRQFVPAFARRSEAGDGVRCLDLQSAKARRLAARAGRRYFKMAIVILTNGRFVTVGNGGGQYFVNFPVVCRGQCCSPMDGSLLSSRPGVPRSGTQQ